MSDVKGMLHAAFGKHRSPPFELVCWDGSSTVFGTGTADVRIQFKTPEAATYLLQQPDMGLGDGYMYGDIAIEGDLVTALGKILWPMMMGLSLSDQDKSAYAALQALRRNTITRVETNVRHHYDLGNDFYKQWLDKNMTYSCAYFARPEMTLEEAQVAKVEMICRKLLLNRTDELLDIGCGWGHLMFHAVENYGVKTHGVTLAKNQYEYISGEIERRKLSDRCRVSLQDYRVTQGAYTKISSVSMFEHVGKDFVREYFATIDGLLVDGGLTLLHTIGNVVDRPVEPWYEKNIFPGYYLSVPSEIHAAAEARQLAILDTENLRRHYVKTLGIWHNRYESNVAEIRRLGFDENFVRMWRYFLTCSQATMDAGNVHLYQYLFSKGTRNDLPMTREHLYRPL